MSLLLNGALTMTIAGTQMQCLEIYTGEAYTLPLTFTNSSGSSIDITGWGLSAAAKFYTVDTVSYPNSYTVDLGNLTLNSPQPSTGAGTYSANLVIANTIPNLGQAYLYIPSTITGGTGSPNPTPVINLANTSANSTLVIVTMTITRTDPVSTKSDISREPLGFIVRYQ